MFSEHFPFDHDGENLKDFQKKRPVVLETVRILQFQYKDKGVIDLSLWLPCQPSYKGVCWLVPTILKPGFH